MNLSETVVAAMIGAGATVATAVFQLVMAFRARKADYKPKRGSGLRSMLAVCGLVLGAAVAGFAYSELRAQQEREQNRAMEQRISYRLQALANLQLAQLRSGKSGTAVPVASASAAPAAARSEAMVHISACRPQIAGFGGDPAGCDSANANRVALCASVPAQASVHDVQLFAHADGDSVQWETSRVAVDQDLGGARFSDGTYEVRQGADRKAVCAQFLQWNSERGHVARIIAVYTTGAPTAPRAASVSPEGVDQGVPQRAVDAGAVAIDSKTVAVDEKPVAAETASPDPARDAAQAVAATQP